MDSQPPDISQNEKNIFFGTLDLNMNTMVLQALLHGESMLHFLRFTFRLSSCRSVYRHCSGNVMDHMYVDCPKRTAAFAELIMRSLHPGGYTVYSCV